MLMKELIELYEGKKPKPIEPKKPTTTLAQNLEKFEKSGGQIIGDVKNGSEVGKIGAHNKGQWNQAVIVFYPDGSYDRFDHDATVIYRDGWKGVEVDTDHLKGKKRELTAYEKRMKEFEKNKKAYHKQLLKDRRERDRQEVKKSKKFNRDTTKASKWLAAIDIDDPKNVDTVKLLRKRGGVLDAMNMVYNVILADEPDFEQESLETKLQTVLDFDYLEKIGGVSKGEKTEFVQLPTKWLRWAAASVLI
jgi:hypothetical protein